MLCYSCRVTLLIMSSPKWPTMCQKIKNIKFGRYTNTFHLSPALRSPDCRRYRQPVPSATVTHDGDVKCSVTLRRSGMNWRLPASGIVNWSTDGDHVRPWNITQTDGLISSLPIRQHLKLHCVSGLNNLRQILTFISDKRPNRFMNCWTELMKNWHKEWELQVLCYRPWY